MTTGKSACAGPPLLKFLKRHMRVTDGLRGNAFWVQEPVPASAKVLRFATPLLLALMLIGPGMVFRDGVAVALGLAMAGLAVLVTAGLMLMVWGWGSEWILRWVSM